MEYEIIKPQKTNNGKDDLANLVEKPQWTIEEIALNPSTIDDIYEIVAYTENKNKLLHEWEFKKFLKTGSGLGINFFGPPGTGKSITAEGIAHQLGTNIIRVNYGELESSLVGGTVENLVKVFRKAEETESLLFFDEADAVLSKRISISGSSQAADYGVNSAKSALLTLLDKFNGVIIFATNRFEDYDTAFLRRILFNVEFLPPDQEMRIKLWQFHLSESVPKQVDYEKLADLSEGLCGGDIKNITIKLGLKLLAGKAESINEGFVSKEIETYKEVKRKHSRYSGSEELGK
jgi:SpoVK/Ycf46/Vps4 family AAA+-type ATPase